MLFCGELGGGGERKRESSGKGKAERDGPLTVSEASESGATSDLRLSEREADRQTDGQSADPCPSVPCQRPRGITRVTSVIGVNVVGQINRCVLLV